MKEDLEKKVIKDKSAITCSNEKCQVRGDYWKCYFHQERYCEVYRNSLLRMR